MSFALGAAIGLIVGVALACAVILLSIASRLKR